MFLEQLVVSVENFEANEPLLQELIALFNALSPENEILFPINKKLPLLELKKAAMKICTALKLNSLDGSLADSLLGWLDAIKSLHEELKRRLEDNDRNTNRLIRDNNKDQIVASCESQIKLLAWCHDFYNRSRVKLKELIMQTDFPVEEVLFHNQQIAAPATKILQFPITATTSQQPLTLRLYSKKQKAQCK